MKKIIAILLVVLVAGAVFGAYTPAAAPASTAVDIITSNNGVLEHSISTAAAGTKALFPGTAVPEAGVPVNIALTEAQSVAWYNVKTNTKKAVTVKVNATPLATAIDESTNYYIPYTLKVGSDSQAFSSATAGSTAQTFTEIDLTTTATDLNDKSKGMRYLSKQIQVQFAQDYSQDALEGDYTATITFEITATT